MPPSAVAAIRYRSSSSAPRPCQDCAETCTPMPEGPAPLVQVGQRHPAGRPRSSRRRPAGSRAGSPSRVVAARAASSVIAIACASATEGSRVPSRMKYQASASARVPGPSRAGPSRSSRVAYRSWMSRRCRAAARACAAWRGWRPSPHADWSHLASSRSRNDAVLYGGPRGRGDGQDHAGVEHVGVVGGGAGAGLDHLVQQHRQVGRAGGPRWTAGPRPARWRPGGPRRRRAGGGCGRLSCGRPGRPCSPAPPAAAGPPFPARQAARVAVNQPAHSRIIRFVFPLPVEPTMTMCRAQRRRVQGEHRVPGVADGADGAADRDRVAAGEQRDGAGGAGQALGGGGLPPPLAGVEGDRRGGHDPAEPGGDGVVPPRPHQPGQRQPGREGDRGQRREHPGQVRGGPAGPSRAPRSGRGRGRPGTPAPGSPRRPATPRRAAASRPRPGTAGPAASPAATPRRTRRRRAR